MGIIKYQPSFRVCFRLWQFFSGESLHAHLLGLDIDHQKKTDIIEDCRQTGGFHDGDVIDPHQYLHDNKNGTAHDGGH